MANKARKATVNSAAAGSANGNYADLQAELDSVLAELQREDLDVDAALEYYQHGLKVVKRLERYLHTAENKIIELKARPPAA